MMVQCNECNKRFDDVYHVTYCPHEYFMARYEPMGKEWFDTQEGKWLDKELHENQFDSTS